MDARHSRGRFAAAMLIPLAVLGVLGAAPAQAQDTASITGIVYDSSEYTPLPEVCVSAYPPGSDTAAGIGCADEFGAFSITGLAEGGPYQLRTSAVPGYLAGWYDSGPDRDAAYSYEAPGFAALALRKGTPLSGTVRDADGAPVANAQLTLQPTGSGNARYATTNLGGHWLLYAEPGEYTLTTQLPDFRTLYWQDKRRFDEADPIQVGDTALVLDQTIPARTTVTGTVRNTAGAPVVGICVSAVSVADPSIRGFEVCTDTGGAFRLQDISAGTYRIRASDSTGQYASVSSDPFTIADGQTVTGIDLTVARAGALSGKVVDRLTGAALRGICPSAHDGRGGDYVQGQHATCSDASGSWKFTGLGAGRVTVHLQGDATHLERWAPDAGTQAAATLYRVKVDTTTATGTVRLYRGATVTGVIKDPNGQPLAGAWVTMFGQHASRAGAGEGPYSAQTGTDGRYTITNVPPGRVPALVYPGDEQPFAYQYSGGASDPARAAKLALRYATTSTFNATLRPEGRLKVTLTGVPAGTWVQLDAFTIPSQKPIGFSADVEGNGSGTIRQLPAAAVKLRVQYSDDAGTLHTTWYGGPTYPEASRIVIGQDATSAVAVSVR